MRNNPTRKRTCNTTRNTNPNPDPMQQKACCADWAETMKSLSPTNLARELKHQREFAALMERCEFLFGLPQTPEVIEEQIMAAHALEDSMMRERKHIELIRHDIEY